MRQGFETAETHLRSAISKVISRRHVLNFRKNKISQGDAADALCAQILDHSERRLARVLPKLTQIGVEQREPVVLPKISHETLASIVGTPRSRITYFMNCFRKRGLIDYKGRFVVHPSRLNIALQDE